MTEQEQLDLATMHEAVANERKSFFSYARSLDRMSPETLASCGFRNGRDNAIAESFRRSLDMIQKLNDAYIRKYPD